ncbi:MAG: hypothetical protein IJE89_06065 [Bacilli bacterium]|nr:hypothetical protein [Bacilli bacterium]
MKDFVEKWKTDSKFKAKVQLGLYTLFVVFVAVLAFSSNSNTPKEELENEYNQNNNETLNDEVSIKTPEEYKYTINVTINDNNYKYEGNKQKEKETIIKTFGDITTNYIYEKDNYYKEENEVYIITEKEDVYEPINYNYIEINTINEYLSRSIKENDKHIVYLKDIILGNDSEEYITITINENNINNQNKINIDYTPLMKLFNNDTERYIVNIEIE